MMSAMASPFRVPEDPQASAELDKDTPHIEEPPGYRSLHLRLQWQGTVLTLTHPRHTIMS